MDTVTADDLRIIEQQIGRAPRGVIGVPVRCRFGYPVVVRVYPLLDDKPFPTIHWLTCPFLALAIDRMEAQGGVRDLEQLVMADEELQEQLNTAHRSVVRERLALLTPEDRQTLEKSGMLRSLSERGIGGLQDRSRVKCLHLHVAAHLVVGDPVGRIVLDGLVGGRECNAEKVICSALDRRSRS